MSNTWYQNNREKSIARAILWRKNHPERHRLTVKIWKKKYKEKEKILKRRYKLKKYGLTIEDYANLIKKQNYSCAICNTNINQLKEKLGVDHNHVTGKTRGLLCFPCNSAMGLLKENKNTLIKMLEYIKEYE